MAGCVILHTMKLFSFLEPQSCIYGVTIEVGSGSVFIAITESERGKPHGTVVWSTREIAPLKITRGSEESVKQLMSSLMNAVLRIEQEGLRALSAYKSSARIDTIHVLIGAPWSFTVSKVIKYTQDEAFTVTHDLIESLTAAAEKKMDEDRVESDITKEHGLTILERHTANTYLNHYHTKKPIGKTAHALTLTQMSTIADSYVVHTVTDLTERVLPRKTTKTTTSIVAFNTVVNKIFPDTTEYCLVDVSYEATEVAIVRGGTVRYCTHTPFGINTIARGLSEQLTIPHAEAYSLLREPYYTTAMQEFSEKQKSVVGAVLAGYQEEVTKLFQETGDNLAIPKIVILHGGNSSELFFKLLMSIAAKAATNTTHTIYSISETILEQFYTSEERTALLASIADQSQILSSFYFHIATDVD
jgi:cell division ATPase FtsA